MLPLPRLLLVLDLDETLLHASPTPLGREPDMRFEEYFVYKRPMVEAFLAEAVALFDVAVWSSADDTYVQDMVRQLAPTVPFAFVWGRSRCTYRHNLELDTYCWEKQLQKLRKKGYSLDRVLIVDDTSEKSRTNYGNAVHIPPFEGQEEDKVLAQLLTYLRPFAHVHHVRRVEKRDWLRRLSAG
ncbi:HAD family hydrolase [Hymenobacter mucosus]|uniref:Carboxy-terminal domain RNA polymerase II polypeptide A small phosphatase n=1 Tax=Hymenobacter mucosus TaxID=1411120 RepID=A0A238YEF5_9BACT|nr:HAD family hydrolase [Hymenobacter mucosus]SNR68739.1 carboxy-terminal domain RNA polymerase II polypeptide A small phosphatase [Hymenobacter mucosus]